MIVYGMRHAIAVPSAPGLPEPDRVLTAEGERKLAGIARGLRALGFAPERIWTSPWMRAAQTATTVARVLDLDEPAPTDLLLPGHAPAEVWSKLLKGANEEEVLCVGHEPLLSELGSFLLTGGTGAAIHLKRGGLFAVEVDPARGPGGGALLFLLQPRHLCRFDRRR